MLRSSLAAAGLAAFALSACAAGETDRQALVEEGVLTGVTEEGERVRCKSVRETGSRMTTRVCRTEREWEEIEEDTRQTLRDRNEQTQEYDIQEPAGGPSRR